MPAAQIKSFAQRSRKSKKEIEELWEKAKNIAEEEGFSREDSRFYMYAVGVLKRILNLESTMLDQWDTKEETEKPEGDTPKEPPIDNSEAKRKMALSYRARKLQSTIQALTNIIANMLSLKTVDKKKVVILLRVIRGVQKRYEHVLDNTELYKNELGKIFDSFETVCRGLVKVVQSLFKKKGQPDKDQDEPKEEPKDKKNEMKQETSKYLLFDINKPNIP
jgi:hypothetical protein